MKFLTESNKFWASCLLLGTILYNCTTQDAERVSPYAKKFDYVSKVKLAEIEPSTPSVEITEGNMQRSIQLVAVTTGLQEMIKTGQMPSTVKQALAAMNSIVTEAEAAELVKYVDRNRELPTSIKAKLQSIANHPSMKQYLPAISLPKYFINGKELTAEQFTTYASSTSTVSNAASPSAAQLAQSYPSPQVQNDCKAAVNTAYNSATLSLTNSYNAQINAITTKYNTSTAAASGTFDIATCQGVASTKFGTDGGTANASTGLIKDAYTAYDAAVSAINTLYNTSYPTSSTSTMINLEERNALILMYNTVKNSEIAQYKKSSATPTVATASTWHDKEYVACLAGNTSDRRTAYRNAAKQTYDSDIASVQSNYNSAMTSLTNLRNADLTSCHNQGKVN
ncbi:hypothetical protein GCM10023189_32080 [Nibrella saemangeumensis]|uniref:Lipoprotein n=1 Tax=Nibrella saemangeumensis TaxID=1084526 RepID=A0ABP8N3J5_9BACT